jgi:hypothetical protein
MAAGQTSKPSPAAKAEASLNGKGIEIVYSRPSMHGREIFGGLVPYDKWWRTGANEATALTTEGEIRIGGTNVPAGKYTLYSLPGRNSWKLIINKQTGQWGTEYDESQDLARVDMKVSKTSAPVEQFNITLIPEGSKEVQLVMEWENTRLTVPISSTRK